MDHEERERQAVAAAYEAAVACGGVVCRGSAALAHGWEVLKIPPKPQITIPKNRRTARLQLASVELRKLNLPDGHVDELVTIESRTLTDSLRYYPLTEGLCIADSALRHGFPRYRLDELAREARGPRAFKIKLVAGATDVRAANVFESATRAIALGVAGLNVVPQVSIREDGVFLGRSDLVDEELRIIVEADSAEHHATVKGINKDSKRYDTYGVHGWLVLRFTWTQVVHEPEWVRSILIAAVERRRTELGLPMLRQPRTHWGARDSRAA
jgi:very-short-patch-repair endonuclease